MISMQMGKIPCLDNRLCHIRGFMLHEEVIQMIGFRFRIITAVNNDKSPIARQHHIAHTSVLLGALGINIQLP